MSRTSKKRLLVVGKVLFSCMLMFILYRKIPAHDLGALLLQADFRLFLPIVLLLFLNTMASALKWRLLLLADGVDIPLASLTSTYLIGSFYNLFLPSNIGGDSYRIYDVARKSKSGVRSAASVFADRFSGFVALVILSLLSSTMVAREFGNVLFLLAPGLSLLLLLAVLTALVKEQPVRVFLAMTRLDRIPLLSDLSEKFFLSFQAYGANRRLLLQIMLISFAFQLSVVCIVWLLALTIHVHESFVYFCAFVPLITLLEALPISIFGLGLRDAGYVFFFGWIGMGELQTRSLALLFFAVAVSYSLLGGLAYLGRILSFGSSQERSSGR